MTHGRHLARATAVAAALASALSTLAAPRAWAQGATRDQSTLTAAPTDEQKTWWQQRFGGSFVDLTNYVGSGTFYTSGYHNPYVSTALYLRPTLRLETRYELTLNARIYLEEEYTLPDNPSGRRLTPLDTWIFLAAKNLYTAPRAKVRFSGVVRAVLPTSYESRWAHLVTGLAVGGGANRAFEFGRPDANGKRWGLALGLSTAFTKYLRTSEVRGDGPGDTSGCRVASGAPPSGAGVGPDGIPTASSSDRCGGPFSTSYSFMSAATSALSRGRWTASATLIVINDFRYRAPQDQYTSMYAVPGGRADWTWAIVSLAYELSQHLSLSAGIASYQPALNAQGTNVRFPFFDFSGGNANNYTQLFLGLNGTL